MAQLAASHALVTRLTPLKKIQRNGGAVLMLFSVLLLILPHIGGISQQNPFILWCFWALGRSKPYAKSRLSAPFPSLWYLETGVLWLPQAVFPCPVRSPCMQPLSSSGLPLLTHITAI